MRITPNVRRPLMIVALLLAACAASGPGATLQRYMKIVEAGEVTKATTMFPSALQAQFASKIVAMIGAETDRIKKKGGLKAMDVVKEDVTGDIASVTLTTHYGNGTVDTSTTKLLREDNEWKINPQ